MPTLMPDSMFCEEGSSMRTGAGRVLRNAAAEDVDRSVSILAL